MWLFALILAARVKRSKKRWTSRSLEGTYASPRELLLFELSPHGETSRDQRTNDHREVFNYRRALQHAAASELPLSLRLIRELHAVLLDSVRGKEKAPGEFRKIPVAIGRDYRFVPPPPEQLNVCLDELEKYFHQSDPSFDPLVDCFLLHYQFETIHPFNDGNGRVGRVLLAMTFQHKCKLTKPWLYMSEFFERNRDEYFQRLFDVSARGDWAGWIQFCLNGALVQARETTARCRRLLEIRERYRQSIATIRDGSARLGAIVDGVFETPFLRVRDLVERLEITYPTAKKDAQRLEDAGILKELPNIYPKTYYAPDVFQVAYERLDD